MHIRGEHLSVTCYTRELWIRLTGGGRTVPSGVRAGRARTELSGSSALDLTALAAARPGRCSWSRAYRSDSPPSPADEPAAARTMPAEGQRREFTLR